LAAVAAWVTLIMGLLAVATFFFAPWLIRVVASQASTPVFELAIQQLRIMAPLILLGGWIGLLCGISNELNDFARPALSPLIASIAVIATVLLWPSPLTLAYGTLLGALGQVILQMPAAFKFWSKTPLAPSHLPYQHPAVRSVWKVLLPACISSGVGTLSVIIGTNFASALAPGSISVFDFANKLIQLPLGILMTALLIPIFPLLTRAVIAQDREELEHRISQGLSTIAFATFPLTAVFIVSGLPLVRVIFERGAFDRSDTLATGLVLSILSVGIAAYAARDLIVRVFYAHNDGQTPLLVSVASLVFTAVGMAWVVKPYGLLGLAGVTVAVTIVNFLVLAALLSRKLGRWHMPGLLKNASSAFGAAIAAGGFTRLATSNASWELSLGHCVGSLTLEIACIALIYLSSLAAAGIPVGGNLREQIQKARERLWRKAR
jgi:putative peptidoglycan lipid II flippase